MAKLTMEAEIDHGRIIPSEPDKLPLKGKALVTVIEERTKKPDVDKLKSLFGTLKTDLDAVAWQREVRSEWDK